MKQVELYNDHFQNFKVYGIPKAQLIIADPPYNLAARNLERRAYGFEIKKDFYKAANDHVLSMPVQKRLF